MKRAARRVLPLLLIAGLLGPGCASEPVDDAPVIRPVRTLQVFASGGSRERSFSGTAQAGMESRLSFKVAGTVQEVSVDVGDRNACKLSFEFRRTWTAS